MFPGSLVSWSISGGSQSTTPTPTLTSTERNGPARDRRGARARRTTTTASPTATMPAAEGQVRHVGLGAERGGDDERDQHHVIAAQHRPGGQQHDDPGDQGEVRVPRLGQRQLPVPGDGDGEHGGHGEDAAPAGPPVTDPQRRGDGDEVDDHRPGLQRPRRRAEQAVHRCQQVEAQRPGMAALLGIRADAPGQPDQRGVAGADVAHPQLGHRQVEHRVPALPVQGSERHDERQTDDGDRHGHGPAGTQQPGRQPPGVVHVRHAGQSVPVPPRQVGDGTRQRRVRCPFLRTLCTDGQKLTAYVKSSGFRPRRSGPGSFSASWSRWSTSPPARSRRRRRGDRSSTTGRRSCSAVRVGCAGGPRGRSARGSASGSSPRWWPIPLRGLYRFTGGTMEEGFMLYFPERVARGDVPNVDFLHLYGPGSLHALTGWYELFGYSLPAERTFGLLQHLGIIFGLFALARAWGRLAATAVAALAVFYVLTPDRAHGHGLERRAGADAVGDGLRPARCPPRRPAAAAAGLADRRRPGRPGAVVPARPDHRRRARRRLAALASPRRSPPGRPRRRASACSRCGRTS